MCEVASFTLSLIIFGLAYLSHRTGKIRWYGWKERSDHPVLFLLLISSLLFAGAYAFLASFGYNLRLEYVGCCEAGGFCPSW